MCSISTGKSSSKWLDRLRSSKGFPAADQVDLEQFLFNNTTNHSNSPVINIPNSTANQIDSNSSSNNPDQPYRLPVLNGNQVTNPDGGAGEKELCDKISNVLSELFCMGDFKTVSKKSCRKQPNPKICNFSTSKSNVHACTVLTTFDSNLHKSSRKKKISNQLKHKDRESVNSGQVDCEEKDKGNADLSGFSQTEVTVIDTSFQVWKFDKLLFRRKNVWKVRDRKCKSIVFNKRKRNQSLVSKNGCPGEEKKQCGTSKDMDHEEGLAPSHPGNKQSNKIKGTSKKKYDVHGQAHENNRKVPRELKGNSSSAVLIKNVPTSKKTLGNLL